MDMNDGSSMTVMMTPWLHFTRGDALWLAELTPTSSGAVVGACIFVFALAVFERFYAGMSARVHARWATKTRTIMKAPQTSNVSSQDDASSSVDMHNKESMGTVKSTLSPTIAFTRTIPPFILAHDFPRGLLFMGHSIIRYMLMLTVMTYSASYIISILIGLSVGEIAFGRFGAESATGF